MLYYVAAVIAFDCYLSRPVKSVLIQCRLDDPQRELSLLVKYCNTSCTHSFFSLPFTYLKNGKTFLGICFNAREVFKSDLIYQMCIFLFHVTSSRSR